MVQRIVTASKVDEMTIDVKGGGKMPVEKYCMDIGEGHAGRI